MWPACVIAAAACVYGVTAPRHILGPDNPEFATLFRLGGAAHPSGYPAYVLYLRAMRWLPAASPAHGAALATVLLAVVGLFTAYRAMRALGASVAASTIVLAVHAFSARVWILGTYGEVFAMNAAIAGAIVWIAVAEQPSGWRRVALLGLLAGLGLSDHHSIVLLAPIGLYGVVRGVREDERVLRTVLVGVAAFASGLVPYTYLLYVGRHPEGHFVWGETSTWAGLLFHFRRGEYGTVTFAVRSQASDRLGQLVFLTMSTLRGLLFLPVLALVSIRKKPRAATIALFASIVLAGPAFVALFNLTTVGLDRLIVERFHLLPQVLLAIAIAPALDPVVSRARLAVVAAIPLALFSAFLSFLEVRAHHRPSIELYIRNTLAIVPPESVILGSGDHRFDGFIYARDGLDLRRDVAYVDVWSLFRPWYHRRMSAILGYELVRPVERSLSTVALADQVLATGRPLFVANEVSDTLLSTFPNYPIGTLRRILPRGTPLPPPAVVEQWNEQALAQMTFEPTIPESGTWGGELQKTYATPWLTLATVWQNAGQLDRAAACRKRAEQLLPDAH